MEVRIDEELLEDLSSFLEDDLTSVIELFISHSHDLIEKIQLACDSQNQDDAALFLHSLKGGAKNMGALSLEDKCLALENKAKDGQLDQVVVQMPLLREEVEELTVRLERYL